MTEAQSSEVERLLLYIADARERAQRAVEVLDRDAADQHIVEAASDAAKQLADLHRKLTQRTFYAVSQDELTLNV